MVVHFDGLTFLGKFLALIVLVVYAESLNGSWWWLDLFIG